jgi:hypothetical protein
MSNIDLGARSDALNKSRTWTQRMKRWFDALPRRVRAHGINVAGWSAFIAFFIWESRNTTLGFEQLWSPGIFLAIMAGVGVNFACVFLVRLMMESFRAAVADAKSAVLHIFIGILKACLALGMFGVALIGVWSSLAADTVRREVHSVEVTDDREAIRKNIRALEAEVRALPPTLELGLEADREALRNVENIGRQWDLPKLDASAGGDCDRDLKPYPRSLCNQAAELRADIATAEAAVKTRTAIEKKLEAEKKSLADLIEGDKTEGVEHLQEMSNLLDNGMDPRTIGSLITLIVSGILMLITAFLGDIMLERRQNKSAGATP